MTKSCVNMSFLQDACVCVCVCVRWCRAAIAHINQESRLMQTVACRHVVKEGPF